MLGRPEVFGHDDGEDADLCPAALGPAITSVVRSIVRDAARQDDHFSSLVLGVINSMPFQMRKAQEAEN